MNYFMKCQLLSEGFKHEQLIEEDWEELKKQLADLYAKNEITQRQVQTRLARAGCTYAAHHAQKIADERGGERQAIINRLEKEKQEKAMRAAAEAQAAKHQTRGSAAAEYNSEASRAAWLKAANEYRERKEKERQNLSRSFTKAWNNHEVGNIVKAKVVKEDVFENMFNKLCEMEEELNIELTEEQATNLFEEVLEEIVEESLLTEVDFKKYANKVKEGAKKLPAKAKKAGAAALIGASLAGAAVGGYKGGQNAAYKQYRNTSYTAVGRNAGKIQRLLTSELNLPKYTLEDESCERIIVSMEQTIGDIISFDFSGFTRTRKEQDPSWEKENWEHDRKFRDGYFDSDYVDLYREIQTLCTILKNKGLATHINVDKILKVVSEYLFETFENGWYRNMFDIEVAREERNGKKLTVEQRTKLFENYLRAWGFPTSAWELQQDILKAYKKMPSKVINRDKKGNYAHLEDIEESVNYFNY